jgi:hypothetical protein
MLSGAAVEVDAVDLDTQSCDLLEALFSLGY